MEHEGELVEVEVEGGYVGGHQVEYEVEERQYVVGKDGKRHEVSGSGA